MMVIFYPGPSVSWCGEALAPPLFLMRHDGKLPRALCCQIVTHCLVVISRQTPACVCSHAHTHVCRHLWLCALITLCEITAVTTAVWATPCFPGHSGHQLPITSYSTVAVRQKQHIMRVLLAVLAVQIPLKRAPSIHLALPFFNFPSPSCPSPHHFQIVDGVCVCVCGHLWFIDWCGRGTGLTGAPPLGEWKWVGGLPLSLWCVTSAAALSPTNGAAVEPRQEMSRWATVWISLEPVGGLQVLFDQHQRMWGRCPPSA